MRRKEAALLGEILQEYVAHTKLDGEFVKLKVYDEWENAVGRTGADATLGRYYSGGILYCTISSSAVRNMLYCNLPGIIRRINAAIPGAPLKKIVLR